MSFGFGNNNTNTSTGFGGFGSGSGGFGSNNNNTSNSGSLFGGGANNTSNAPSTGGFGGFGSTNTNNPFGGSKPAGGFGAPATTSSGSMFGGGSGTSTTGGGFGSTGGFGGGNTASSGFGASNTSGGLFGANKPATTGFGATGTTGGSMFGSGGTSGGFGNTNNNTTTAGFGGNAASTGFGSTNTGSTTGGFGGFGASNQSPATTNNGTAGTPFQATQEKDGTSNQVSQYQSITFQQPHQSKSFEELRVEDYAQGRRYGNTNGQAGSFGQSTGFGGSNPFGSTTNQNTSTGGSLFGANNNQQQTGTTGGFGGFGSTQNTGTATSGFGANNTSTGGGLFGGQKTLGSGFGSTQTSGATTGGFGNTTSGNTGSLFGSNTGGTFGANNNSNTGSSLFAGNNQQQNKPAGGFGGFGSTTNNASSGFGGTNNTTGSSLFGGGSANNTNTGSSLFGGGQNQNQQPQQSNPFGGGNTGSSLFGGNQNQQKPAGSGLFGPSTAGNNTGSSLFPNQNQPQQSGGGLFGAGQQNNNTGGSLFPGNNQQNKPAAGGLFGGSTAGANNGGGLFGGNQNQQQSGGSMFGGNQNTGGSSLFGGNQNKPAGSSLFGGNTSTGNTGSSLFGGGLGQNNQNNQQNNGGSSLFGGGLGQSNQQTQNNNSLFGSNYGQSQNQTPQNNQLHASLTMSPYGNDQLFGSLQQTSTPVGPLATPLNGARAAASKTPSLLSSTRLNSPIYTPRASTLNRTGTYGLSYSTYGTPNSSFSVSLTPQQSTSLMKPGGSLGSALSSRLAKSMSMSHLRGADGTPREGESLLRPTPGSASSKYLQSGSMRKLTIDRSLRTDLFAPPENPKSIESSGPGAENPGLRGKRVSFPDVTPPHRESNAQPSSTNALVRTEEPEEQEASPALFRAAPKPQAQAQSNGVPEMQQVNGSSLSTVHEDGDKYRSASAPATKHPAEKVSKKGIVVGEYWTKPSMRDLRNMSREQLKNVGNFTVGRENVGYIEFGNVDLSKIELDDVCGKICIFELRSVTVYPDANTKPPVGQGLNVPSTIHLEHSYPKKHSARVAHMAKKGPAYEKHLAHLKKTLGTTFKSYDADTGIWTFQVEHYTTYGFDDDGEDDEGLTEDVEMQQESSGLSEPPEDETMQSLESGNGTGEMDDTFEFKIQSKRSQQSTASAPAPHMPGGFDEPDELPHLTYDYDDVSADELGDEHMMSGGLGQPEEEDLFNSPGGAVQAPSPGAYERYHSSMALDEDTGAVEIAEQMQDEPEPELPGSFIAEEPKFLRSILKPTPGFSAFASPEKLATDTWEEQLQRTMSPKKRDRQALKDRQQSVLRGKNDEDVIESPFKRSMLGQSAFGQSNLGQSYLTQKSAKKAGAGSAMNFGGDELGKSQAFRTSMDIMNSLWANEKTSKKAPSAARGFENPYPKKRRLSTASQLSDKSAAFIESVKPTFTNNGVLLYSVPGSIPEVSEPLTRAMQPIVGEHKDLRFAKFASPIDINTHTLTVQKEATAIALEHGFPIAETDSNIVFKHLKTKNQDDVEDAIWGVADILFDSVTTACDHLTAGMSPEQVAHFEPRLRKDAFESFWNRMLNATVEEQIRHAKGAELKALLLLSKNDVKRAAEVLADARDFKLATIVAQLPGSHDTRAQMQDQIKAWMARNDWSEMSEPIRAIYSIVAGEVCTVAGKNAAAEDYAKSFCISERFGLNWMQSFGLRVFFGGHSNLDNAIKAYCNDLNDGHEKVLPKPWWQDAETEDSREDTLLGLLRLYIGRPDLEGLVDPKTVSGSSVNSRIAWQLATVFHAKRYTAGLADEQLDELTLDYAAQLEFANQFLSAVWVLLHLRNKGTREKAIIDILNRNAGKIPNFDPLEDVQGVFHRLNHDLGIPTEHIWHAKALHARAEDKNPVAQAIFLLNAGDNEQAHQVVCNTIGPKAVIEQEHDDLVTVLQHFPEQQKPEGWIAGGGVFEDFAELWNLSLHKKQSREGKQVMERLGVGLSEMANREGKMSLEERVAVVEMERVLREDVRGLHGSGEGLVVEGVADMVGSGKGMDAFVRYREAMGVVA